MEQTNTTSNIIEFPKNRIVRQPSQISTTEDVETFLKERTEKEVTVLTETLLNTIYDQLQKSGVNPNTLDERSTKAFLLLSESASLFSHVFNDYDGHPLEQLLDFCFEYDAEAGVFCMTPPRFFGHD